MADNDNWMDDALDNTLGKKTSDDSWMDDALDGTASTPTVEKLSAIQSLEMSYPDAPLTAIRKLAQYSGSPSEVASDLFEWAKEGIGASKPEAAIIAPEEKKRLDVEGGLELPVIGVPLAIGREVIAKDIPDAINWAREKVPYLRKTDGNEGEFYTAITGRKWYTDEELSSMEKDDSEDVRKVAKYIRDIQEPLVPRVTKDAVGAARALANLVWDTGNTLASGAVDVAAGLTTPTEAAAQLAEGTKNAATTVGGFVPSTIAGLNETLMRPGERFAAAPFEGVLDVASLVAPASAVAKVAGTQGAKAALSQLVRELPSVAGLPVNVDRPTVSLGEAYPRIAAVAKPAADKVLEMTPDILKAVGQKFSNSEFGVNKQFLDNQAVSGTQINSLEGYGSRELQNILDDMNAKVAAATTDAEKASIKAASKQMFDSTASFWKEQAARAFTEDLKKNILETYGPPQKNWVKLPSGLKGSEQFLDVPPEVGRFMNSLETQYIPKGTPGKIENLAIKFRKLFGATHIALNVPSHIYAVTSNMLNQYIDGGVQAMGQYGLKLLDDPTPKGLGDNLLRARTQSSELVNNILEDMDLLSGATSEEIKSWSNKNIFADMEDKADAAFNQAISEGAGKWMDKTVDALQNSRVFKPMFDLFSKYDSASKEVMARRWLERARIEGRLPDISTEDLFQGSLADAKQLQINKLQSELKEYLGKYHPQYDKAGTAVQALDKYGVVPFGRYAARAIPMLAHAITERPAQFRAGLKAQKEPDQFVPIPTTYREFLKPEPYTDIVMPEERASRPMMRTEGFTPYVNPFEFLGMGNARGSTGGPALNLLNALNDAADGKEITTELAKALAPSIATKAVSAGSDVYSYAAGDDSSWQARRKPALSLSKLLLPVESTLKLDERQRYEQEAKRKAAEKRAKAMVEEGSLPPEKFNEWVARHSK